MYPLD